MAALGGDVAELVCLVCPQNVKDRDKAMMEMKRELKKLQVRVLIQ